MHYRMYTIHYMHNVMKNNMKGVFLIILISMQCSLALNLFPRFSYGLFKSGDNSEILKRNILELSRKVNRGLTETAE
jgi:hypothetical protein